MEAVSEVAAGAQRQRKDWFGQPRGLTILFGGAIMAIGHFMMAFESLFFVALATIGNRPAQTAEKESA